MPMDGHHRARLQGVEHTLALVGGGVTQVEVHPQARRGLGLSGQGIEELLVNKHVKCRVESYPWECQPSTGLGAWAWPTWGRGARLVRWALDVGLDPLVLSYQEERTKITFARPSYSQYPYSSV